MLAAGREEGRGFNDLRAAAAGVTIATAAAEEGKRKRSVIKYPPRDVTHIDDFAPMFCTHRILPLDSIVFFPRQTRPSAF